MKHENALTRLEHNVRFCFCVDIETDTYADEFLLLDELEKELNVEIDTQGWYRTDEEFWYLWNKKNVTEELKTISTYAFSEDPPTTQYQHEILEKELWKWGETILWLWGEIEPYLKRKEDAEDGNDVQFIIGYLQRIHDNLINKYAEQQLINNTSEPATEPEKPTLTDEELKTKVQNDAKLLSRFTQAKNCFTQEWEPIPDDEERARIAYDIIKKGLFAYKQGRKQWQSTIKNGIDEYKHTFGKMEPKDFCILFAQYGLPLKNNTVSNWRMEWEPEKRRKKDN